MKYVFNPQAYARLVGAVADPFTADDGTVAPYADNYFEYDSTKRVTKEVVQGEGCSACTGGFGTFTFTYQSVSNPLFFNSWQYKTTETFYHKHNGADEALYQNIVYCNFYGEVMLKVFHDQASGNEWKTLYKYNDTSNPPATAGAGAIVMKANPSAIDNVNAHPGTPGSYNGYDENFYDLMDTTSSGDYGHIRQSDGLIKVTDYYATTDSIDETHAGGVAGYIQDTKLQHGRTDPAPAKQTQLQYYKRVASSTNGGATVYPVATSSVYRTENVEASAETTTNKNYT